MHCMRRYFLLPYVGIRNQRMKKLLFIVIAGTALSCAAFAQSQRQISNILREQQQWKNRQLPANSVQRNFGGTNYAAAAWMESNKFKKHLRRIELPQSSGNAVGKGFSGFKMKESSDLAVAIVRIRTSFMQWLTTYLPERAL